MKTIISRILLMAMALVWSASALAQENTTQPKEDEKKGPLTIDAQMMARGEYRRGGLPTEKYDKDENNAHFVFERTRMTLGYEKSLISAKVTAQHQGIWGMEGGGSFEIYEAWAQLKAKNGLFARIGRQELVYDDERILGNNDWSMAAMTHDVLKVGYENYGHRLHAIFAYNQNSGNVNGGTYYKDGSQTYKSMQTAWYHYDVPKIPIGVSLIFMNVGMQLGTPDDYGTINQQIYGGYLTFKPKKLSLEAAYYRQGGKAPANYLKMNEDGYSQQKSLPVEAWMASVKATYEFSPKVTAYAGYDYLSGDKEFVVPDEGDIGLVQHKKVSAFTSIFGSSHKFYGAMDFFFVSAYYSSFSPGLQTLYAGSIFKPVKDLTVDASYNYFGITSSVSKLNTTLGHEIELSASYQFAKDANISLGYSFMMGTETMERLKRSTDRHKLHWAWLMLSFTPRLL